MAEETKKVERLNNLNARWEWGLLILILAGAIAARVILMREIMPGPRLDELKSAEAVEGFLEAAPGYTFEILSSGQIKASLYHAAAAGLWSLLGHNLFALRLTSAIFGIFTVLSGYLLARKLFGNRAALFAAAGLSFAFIPLYFSRVGLATISLPAFTGVAALGLYHALNPDKDEEALLPRVLWSVGGGISLGLSLYTSAQAFAMVFIFLIFTVVMLVKKVRVQAGDWLPALIFYLTAGGVFTPVLLSIHRTIGLRTWLGRLWAAIIAVDPLTLIANLGRNLLMFIGRGEDGWIANISGAPIFPGFMAILFFMGLVLALIRSKKPAYLFASLLLLGGLLPGLWADVVPSYAPVVNILPILFVFPAIAFLTINEWLVFLAPERNRLIATILILIAGLYLGQGLRDYFFVWSRVDQARYEYNPGMLKLAEYIEDHDEIATPIISTSLADFWTPWDRLSFDLLYHGDAEVHFFDASTSLVAPDSDGPVYYFLTHNAPMNADWWYIISQAELIEQVMDDGQAAFTVYRLPDSKAAGEAIAVTDMPEWELGFSLLEYEMRFDEAVRPLRHDIERWIYRKGETINLQTTWRVLTPPAEPLVMYVHLLDAEGKWIAGWDDLDIPVEGWREGDVFALKHQIAIPGDIPGGTYTITIGWYSPLTEERQPLYLNDKDIGDALKIADIVIAS